MARSRIAGTALALLLLAACNRGASTGDTRENQSATANGSVPTTFEDVSPDSLAAPANTTLGTGEDEPVTNGD